MLDSAIRFLADELNLYLKRQTASGVVEVVPGGLTDDAGKWAVAEGGIGLALVNVEEERVLRAQVPEHTLQFGRLVARQPDLQVNLQVIFAVRPRAGSYLPALKYLSYILTYFQARPVFTNDEYPALDAEISKLSVELLSYGPEQLNHLWAYLGTKYLPSAVYRVRLLALQDSAPFVVGSPITTIESVLHGK